MAQNFVNPNIEVARALDESSKQISSQYVSLDYMLTHAWRNNIIHQEGSGSEDNSTSDSSSSSNSQESSSSDEEHEEPLYVTRVQEFVSQLIRILYKNGLSASAALLRLKQHVAKDVKLIEGGKKPLRDTVYYKTELAKVFKIAHDDMDSLYCRITQNI